MSINSVGDRPKRRMAKRPMKLLSGSCEKGKHGACGLATCMCPCGHGMEEATDGK